ncbi:MAG: cellobiose phosphorylase [Leptothrix sp. (in: Bacteria)]|jgi:methyl-accepting chemotaxis protein|nr:cellobiose phosphorylase [Leptothrix sp. (in: b-proteobacteria)]HQY07618.1 methyl-accepting chemotaxis protein [Burkholderiaceae bacterium]
MFKHSLKAQLALGFAAVVATFLIALMFLGGQLMALEQGVQRVDQRSLPLVTAVDRMDLSRSEVQQFLTDVAATHDPAAYQEADAAAKLFLQAADDAAGRLTEAADSDKLAELGLVRRDFDRLHRSGREMAEAYVRDGLEAGNRLMKGHDGQPGFDALSASLGERLTGLREAVQAQARADAEADLLIARRMRWSMIASALLATAVAGLAAATIIRRVLRQLGGEPQRAVSAVEQVGQGDLASPVPLDGADADSLLAHLSDMQQRLAHVVHTVRDRATQVETASIELEKGSQDLAERTAAHAGSLAAAASSMQQVNEGVQSSAAGALQANQKAEAAREAALRGGELVENFVGTMDGIQQSSRRIAEIIGVIDGIAFQTNILALNAAVEAARAGEQGRGFNVVASEVRSLASRSAEAAREIKALISTSVERVEEGTRQVGQARAVMTEVVTDIEQLSQAVGDISRATARQQDQVAQVAGAVSGMDQVTQQNAAMVEQSAAAIGHMRRQAHELRDAVDVFRLANDPASA